MEWNNEKCGVFSWTLTYRRYLVVGVRSCVARNKKHYIRLEEMGETEGKARTTKLKIAFAGLRVRTVQMAQFILMLWSVCLSISFSIFYSPLIFDAWCLLTTDNGTDSSLFFCFFFFSSLMSSSSSSSSFTHFPHFRLQWGGSRVDGQSAVGLVLRRDVRYSEEEIKSAKKQ